MSETDDGTLITTRPLLRHYPAGVAAEVDLAKYRSLPPMADDAFARYAQRTS